MTTSFPPISYPSKPVPPFTAEPPKNPFPGFFPDMWKNITGKPYTTVSSKGLANGQSEYFNDGADFGPDSLQADGSLTQTSGIQEAWNYAVSVAIYNSSLGYFIPAIKLEHGYFNVQTTIKLSSGGKRIINPKIYGDSNMAPYIGAAFNSGYLFDLDASSFNYSNIEFSRMQPYVPSGYTPTGIINADFSSTNPRTNIFVSYEFNISNTGWTGSPMNLVAFGDIVFYDLNDYSDTVSVYSASQTIQFFGGVIFGINAQSSSVSSDAVSLNIFGARYTVIELGAGLDLYLIGGRATGFNGFSGQVILNGDVNTVHIVSRLYDIAFPFVTGSYTIRKLFIRGTVGNQYFTESETLIDSIVTIENADINLVNVTSYSVIVPINTPTTPSVPASGTAQENTNPYAVDVYVYGGDVTEIQITRNGTAYTVFSNSSGVAMSGQSYSLNPGDSITVTYSTAPSWEWLSD